MRLRGASRRALLYFREISAKYGRSGARARYRSRIALKYSGALLNPKPETYDRYWEFTRHLCGNRVLDAVLDSTEQCDDGNQVDGDGCTRCGLGPRGAGTGR